MKCICWVVLLSVPILHYMTGCQEPTEPWEYFTSNENHPVTEVCEEMSHVEPTAEAFVEWVGPKPLSKYSPSRIMGCLWEQMNVRP